MSNEIVVDVKDITMSSKFIRLETEKGELIMDLKKLFDSEGEEAYINVTHIAKIFKRDVREFFKLKTTREYECAVLEMIEEKSHQSPFKLKFTKRGSNKKSIEDKIYGTYLYKDLAIIFFRWLDVRFAVKCDLFLQSIIKQCRITYIERDNTKVLFKDLIRVIKEVYIPAQESDNAKKFAYSNLSGLINIKVLGCTGDKYAKKNDIKVEKGKSVRDYLSSEQLDAIKEAERVMSGMIEFGGVTDYEKLKEILG